MAVNKNFVVKNGLEVATDVILANASTKNVGIGSTQPSLTLDVRGGIGATDLQVTGFSTFTKDIQVGASGSVFYVSNSTNMVGVGTSVPAYALEVRGPVSTGVTALYVRGDVRVTGDLNLSDVNVNDLTVSGALDVDGHTELDDVNIAGVVTATSFTGDGSNLTGTATNLTATIGIASGGTTIGSGITMVDFTATNATVTVAASSATPTGVATVNVQPSVSLGLAIALGG